MKVVCGLVLGRDTAWAVMNEVCFEAHSVSSLDTVLIGVAFSMLVCITGRDCIPVMSVIFGFPFQIGIHCRVVWLG